MRENHILIIDDDLMLLKTAEEILSDQYNVSVAKSGIQALNLLNKNIIPDLILLDIDMPQMDGYETLEEIKKEPTFQIFLKSFQKYMKIYFSQINIHRFSRWFYICGHSPTF